MKKMTKHEIRKYESNEPERRLKEYQIKHNTTGVPNANALGLRCIGFSSNYLGCDGHLYEDIKTGEKYGVPHRNEFIYIV